MTSSIELVDVDGGVAVIVPPHLCKRLGSALGAVVERFEAPGRRTAGPMVDLSRRLLLAAQLTEAGQQVALAEPVPGRPEGWCTVSEAAKYLGISREAVRKACRVGRLRAVAHRFDGRTWMVPVAAIEEQP